MNKPKLILKNHQPLLAKPVLISFLLFFLLTNANYTNAQKRPSSEAQWKSAGGMIIASGNYQFKQSDPASGILQGSFTVQGPGYIGIVYKRIRSIGPYAHLRGENGGGSTVRNLGSQDLLKGADGNWNWYPSEMITEDYTPNANKGGWVPKPTPNKPTTTLEVWVAIEGGGRENDDRAIEYEFWYFPLEGGKAISTTFSNASDKPMPGVVYYTDKECK